MQPLQFATKIRGGRKSQTAMLKDILQEIRLLRHEIMFFFPQEDLEKYAHPKRIERSYRKALGLYPPQL